MQFLEYLALSGETPFGFSRRTGVPSTTAHRAAHGRPLGAKSIARIVQATGGAVSALDLLGPRIAEVQTVRAA